MTKLRPDTDDQDEHAVCARAEPGRRSLANLAKRNLVQLTALVKTRLRRMQYRPALLGGFLASTGLELFSPTCLLRLKR